jgi:hypothetical protein
MDSNHFLSKGPAIFKSNNRSWSFKILVAIGNTAMICGVFMAFDMSLRPALASESVTFRGRAEHIIVTGRGDTTLTVSTDRGDVVTVFALFDSEIDQRPGRWRRVEISGTPLIFVKKGKNSGGTLVTFRDRKHKTYLMEVPTFDTPLEQYTAIMRRIETSQRKGESRTPLFVLSSKITRLDLK